MNESVGRDEAATPLARFNVGDKIVNVNTPEDIAKLARTMRDEQGQSFTSDSDRAVMEAAVAAETKVNGTKRGVLDILDYGEQLADKCKLAEQFRTDTIKTLRAYRMAIDTETQLIVKAMARSHGAAAEINALALAIESVNKAFADINHGKNGFRLLMEALMNTIKRHPEETGETPK